MKKNFLLVFGTPSPEYYVNCKTATAVAKNVDTDIYNLYTVGISKDGTWIYTETELDNIKDGESWLNSVTNKPAIISPDKKGNLIIFESNNKIRKIKIDVAFAPVAGSYGEDGKLSALFDMAGIPYVGSDSISSGCSLDKGITRIFADDIGLKQPDCVVLSKNNYINNKDKYIAKINELKYPLFVKPALTGSSIGISKVINNEKLCSAIDLAFQYCDDVLVEEGIEGTEIKVALFGNNDNLIAGSICGLVANNNGESFNDYETKYDSSKDNSQKEIPAKISNELEEEIVKQAKNIFNALKCRDYSRVDFFLSKNGEIVFNEINTNPGMSEGSIYSLMMNDKGYTYKQIVNSLIEMALNRK